MTKGRALLPRGRGRLLLALIPLAALFVFQGADAQTRFMYLSGQSIHPAFEGWWPDEDGSFTLWFGYMNSNWEEEFDVPIGPDNYFAFTEPRGLDDLELDQITPSEVDQGQPTHFYPRRNPFLFTVRVPEDFGVQELVWTLTTHGRRNRVYASLRPDYRMDTQVMSTEVGGSFGSLDDRLRANQPPALKVEGDMHRSVTVGKPLTLVARADDPDDFRRFSLEIRTRRTAGESGRVVQYRWGRVECRQQCTWPAAVVVRLPRLRRICDLRSRADESVDGYAGVGKLTMVASVHSAGTASRQQMGGRCHLSQTGGLRAACRRERRLPL